MTTLGQNVKQFTLQYAGAPVVSSEQPTWSSSQQNNFTNNNGQNLYLAFVSNRIPVFANTDTTQGTVNAWTIGPSSARTIYYGIASRNNGANLLQEVAPTDLDSVASDGVRELDTANDTLQGGVLNDRTKPRFRDQYPAFAPFVKVFRLGFQSNRSGTYAKDGVGVGFTVTDTKTNNLFIASLIDITAADTDSL